MHAQMALSPQVIVKGEKALTAELACASPSPCQTHFHYRFVLAKEWGNKSEKIFTAHLPQPCILVNATITFFIKYLRQAG